MPDFIDELKSLHTALIDSRNGYEEALADSEGEGLMPLFREMMELRIRHEEQLTTLLRSNGEEADESGSFMSTVHRTVIRVRSLFGGLDASALPGLIDGEQRIVGYYADVMKNGPPAAATEILVSQRREVEDKIAEMQQMQERSS